MQNFDIEEKWHVEPPSFHGWHVFKFKMDASHKREITKQT